MPLIISSHPAVNAALRLKLVSSRQWRIQDFGSGGSNFRHPGQDRQYFQGRINHVANVSVKTGTLTKCKFQGPTLRLILAFLIGKLLVAWLYYRMNNL